MYKKLFLVMALTTAVLAQACRTQPSPENPLISKSNLTLTSDHLTPEVLNRFGRVSDPQVSPSGQQIFYGVSYTSVEQNKSNRELFVMDIDGSHNRQITQTPSGESNARWLGNDGLLFLYQGQIWKMLPDGSQRTQISHIEGGIVEFALAPTQDKILFTKMVQSITKPVEKYPDLDKATGRLIDDLMYRHWDCFVEEIPRTFVAPFNGQALGEAVDLLEGQPYELPTLPFGDLTELSFSPNGEQIAYSCRKLTGRDYALSTNTDIYLRNLTTGEEVNLSKGIMGYDTRPLFSPNGRYIVWCSMERDGYEADKDRLLLHDFTTGTTRDLTKDFIYNVESVSWMAGSQGVYFTSCAQGVTHVFALDIESGAIRQITNGPFDCGAMQPVSTPQGGEVLIGTYMSMSMPSEIVAVDPVEGAYTQLSFENKHLLDQLTMGRVEARWITTTDRQQMLTWVVYPPHFDSSKQYPMLLFCNGGPQSTLSQSWSYRWCFQLMAANDYIVILPNRRGNVGFGHQWCEQISGDYTGQNMRDYLSAVDQIKKEPFVDEHRVGAVGASYGGYSVYYLAGHHENRFSAFVAHAGIFNLEQMYMVTEETWFPNWDNGGAPWSNTPLARKNYADSPHKSVTKWNTPILVTHGELDYRVPVEQGMAAFNAAKLLGVPAEMLLFPDENHWILKPQNNILWNRVFFTFLDKYLK